MTDWRSLRGSNFLSPQDLETGPALITITAVQGEEMLDDKEQPKKEVALTIKARHRNPETGQTEDLPKTEWVANVVNLNLLEALFGTPHVEQWVGRKALLQQEPCEVAGKYFGEPSVRVYGGPDLEVDLPVEIVLKMKGGKKRKPIHKVLHPTRNGGGGSPANVDPATGEVTTPAPANQAASGQEAAIPGADSPAAAPEATPAPAATEAAQPAQASFTPPAAPKTAVEIGQENLERALQREAVKPIASSDVNFIATQCTIREVAEDEVLAFAGVDSLEAIPAARLEAVKGFIAERAVV